jgi:hypothetical protein
VSPSRPRALLGCLVAGVLVLAAGCSSSGRGSRPVAAPAPASTLSGGTQPPAQTAGTTQAERGLAVTPASLPAQARPGEVATASFDTRPGNTCQLELGADVAGAPTRLPPATADSVGRVSWTWRLSPDVRAGTLMASVVCSGGATGQARITVA